MNHCRCCSGHFIEDDVLGDCPGCPECADADEWHRAIMEEACDAGERDEHCECVPVLRKACAEKEAEIARLTAVVEELQEEIQIQTDDKYALVSQMSALITERDALQAATRKVVEALRIARQYVQPFTYDSEKCDDALADPTIVALGRE